MRQWKPELSFPSCDFRRRLEKRLYIPLPGKTARMELFRLNLKEVPVSDCVDFEELAEKSEGYSGRLYYFSF